jgi:tetratricopeptide (TPR) repeat protein
LVAGRFVVSVSKKIGTISLIFFVIVLAGCGNEPYEETYQVAKKLSQKGPLTDTEYVRRLETSDELLEQIASLKLRASDRQHYVLRRSLNHYENLRMWNKALPVAEKLTRLQPTKEEWYIRLGRIHATLSRVEEGHIEPAVRAFETALEIDPESVRANYGLGMVYGFHADKPKQGRTYLRKAAYEIPVTVKNRPHVVDARFALGKLEFQEGRTGAAQEAFEKILEMESVSQESRFLALKNLGDVHRSRNAKELAKEYYHKAYDIQPTDSSVRSRLRQLGVTVEDRFNRFE